MRLALPPTLIALVLSGCKSSGGSAAGAPPSIDSSPADADTIQATVRVLDAMSGAGMEGVAVWSTEDDEATTSADGRASVAVRAEDTFEVLLQRTGAADHLLFGPTGMEDFTVVTFMATTTLMSAVSGMLGVPIEDDLGIVVVGIDHDDLSPAVGASASLSGSHGDPWLLGPAGASFGDTIQPGGMGMVAFPNVEPGQVTVSVSPPTDMTCEAFPAGGEMPPVPVEAGVVTVVTHHCR